MNDIKEINLFYFRKYVKHDLRYNDCFNIKMINTNLATNLQ